MSTKAPRVFRPRPRTQPRGQHRGRPIPKIQWPASSKDILKLFTLSRTNQILRGRSPVFEDHLLDDERNKKWTELVASEILSAKVDVVPKPLEYNAYRVSTDPRRGR